MGREEALAMFQENKFKVEINRRSARGRHNLPVQVKLQTCLQALAVRLYRVHIWHASCMGGPPCAIPLYEAGFFARELHRQTAQGRFPALPSTAALPARCTS